MRMALQKMTLPHPHFSVWVGASSLKLSGLNSKRQPGAVTAERDAQDGGSCDSNPRLLQSHPAQYQQNQLVVEYSHSLEGQPSPVSPVKGSVEPRARSSAVNYLCQRTDGSDQMLPRYFTWFRGVTCYAHHFDSCAAELHELCEFDEQSKHARRGDGGPEVQSYYYSAWCP